LDACAASTDWVNRPVESGVFVGARVILDYDLWLEF
jgi:hypothetical protein